MPAGWANLTLVTDAEIAEIEPQARANVSPPPWGATTWPAARAAAKRELKVLVELAFPKVKGAADRILDLFRPDYAFTLIGSTYTDITTLTTSDDEDDVDLTTIFASAANKLYIGADYQFDGLWFDLKDARNALVRTLTVKYSGGAGFTALTVVDGTAVAGAPFASSGRITWTIPAAWQRRRLASATAEEFFWIELTLDTALSSGSTKAAQILPIRAPDGLKRVAALLSLSYIMNGLERQSGRPEEWRDKAAAYRTQALDLFQDLKERGGIPLDTDKDETISQAEIVDTTPIRLGRA